MAGLSSDQIAGLFLERADRYGAVGLTVKQMNWIVGVFERETRRAFPQRPPVVGMHIPGSQTGWTGYELVRRPNGSGLLKPTMSPEYVAFCNRINADSLVGAK